MGPAHALLQGLRYTGDEVQLTSVVAGVAAIDETFATRFAHAVLEQVAQDCAYTKAAQERLNPVPARLRCDTERALTGPAGEGLGRVDLVFESLEDPPNFTLLVENKLFAGFGPEQMKRYHESLRALRKRGGQGGLVAITRDVPTGGELVARDEEWLGSIRWARLLPRLRRLTCEEAALTQQWALLLDVLDHQGDLGMSQIDADAVRGWARFAEGREALTWLLASVQRAVVEHTGRELKRRHRIAGPLETLATLAKPRTRNVSIGTYEVRFGVSVPAAYKGQTLAVSCWMEDGQPYFGVVVSPRDGENLLDDNMPNLRKQVQALLDLGFVAEGKSPSWYSQHDMDPILSATDAPQQLLDAVCKDVTNIIETGILRYDVTAAIPRKERRTKAETS